VSLSKFFKPKSIAVFGASRTLEKPGRVLLRNLLYGGYGGRVYPVNPNVGELDGLRVYSPEDVPAADLGIFIIPAPAVPKALEQSGDRLKAALVVSGGFGEVGAGKLDEALLAAAQKHDIRVWGPNCLGFMNTHERLNATFLPLSRLPIPPQGKVSILSQSGATVASVLDWATTINLGVSKVASYGNQLDVSDHEILDYFLDDPETDVIGFYVEGVKDGRELVKAARKGGKPVIVLKAGKTTAGVRAAKSHTGALAGDYQVFRGFARQMDWGLARDPEEFLLSLKARSMWKRDVKSVGVVTCGGGYGVMTSDALESKGLRLAELTEAKSCLVGKFPKRVCLDNPIDLTGDATPEMFSWALDALTKDGAVDAIVVILLMQLPRLTSKIVDVLRGYTKGEKPLVVVSPPGTYASGINSLMENVPLVSSPEKAAGVLSVLR
jgi:acetate---CoA ligase (ADP-forming)